MAEILRQIAEGGLCRFADSVSSWEEAVRLGVEPLAEGGYVDADYSRQIIACIRQYGPYMVFDHYAALPHAMGEPSCVHRTGVSLLRVRTDVDFGRGADGTPKVARLLFTLAARGPEEHLDCVQSLAHIFTNEPLLDALMAANTPGDVLAAAERYPLEGAD
ncbi:MAG: PTS sugar transporter subunit IIA [Clostridiales bacterium]|nr:PTS sugar transporter subunit IIA [Clostridiales bacterium]